MITKTAWKNIWRNKTRSLVVIASVTIGIFAGVFAVGVMNGAIDQRVDEVLENEVSHVQITHKDFRSNNDLGSYITGVNSIVENISSMEGVNAVTSRLHLVGMANTARKSAGVKIIGIKPMQEKKLLSLHQELMDGTGDYFEEERGELAYIGYDLAKNLNIIRYRITGDVISKLDSAGLPGEVISAITGFKGSRFDNEKSFKKEMRSLLTSEQESGFGRLILEEAQTFRKRAKFTLTFVDRNNNQTGGVFRVGGIYDIPNSMFESTMVFVRDSRLRSITEMPDNTAHNILISLDDVDDAGTMTEKLRKEYPDLEVMNWKEIQPDMAMMSEMAGAMYGFFMALILAALAFGIVNTMLMVVLERIKELGMLTAIGMNKKKVFRMIMTESVFLSLVGGIAGMIVSWIIIRITSSTGIRFSSMQEGFEAMGFSSHIYPSIGADFFLVVTVLIIITGILSSVYPALKALKLDPADALRTE
ncbi:MAG: FtsX-like permease family protein [Bacteroidales bacterium]|nr:FtsX-like permease family protein [Bacteroidales bacterium]